MWLIVVNRRRRRENRPRRQRTTFSSDQTVKLEIEYSRTEYITRSRRYELAELLCLTENQIKIWFQNRRAKEKRIEKAHMDHHLRYWWYFLWFTKIREKRRNKIVHGSVRNVFHWSKTLVQTLKYGDTYTIKQIMI